MQNYKILNIPKMRLYFEEKQENADNFVSEISFIGGTMLLDGAPVHSYYGKGVHYWERGTERGCMWLRHYGLMGEGFIERVGIRRNFKAGSENIYTLSYTNSEKEEVCLEFTLGVDFDQSGGSMIYCKLNYQQQAIVDYHAGDPEQGILHMSLNKEDNLHIDADFSTLWESVAYLLPAGFYVHDLSMDFDSTYDHVTGTVREAVHDGRSEMSFGLYGRLRDEDVEVLRRRRKRFQMNSAANALLRERFLANVGTDSPCSIDELFGLKEPTSIIKDGKTITGQQQVQNKAVETLYYLAVYHTAEIERDGVKYADIFGINKQYAEERVREISPEILDLLSNEEVKDFLVKYAKVTLGNAVAASQDHELRESLHEVPDAAKRCRNYMSGQSSAHTMSKETGFNIAMTVITKHVYACMVPNLRKYFADGENWGKKLYDYALKRLAMLKTSDLAGTSRITHIAMMLGFLNDKKQNISYKDGSETKTAELTYGAAFYLKVFNMNLAEIAGKVNFDADNHANFLKMMQYVFGVLYDELQKEESDKFMPEILEELKDEMKEFDDMTRESFIDCCLEITEAAMEVLLTVGDLITCITWIGNKYANSPKMYKIGKCVCLAFMSFSLFQCVRMFIDWKDLNWMEQAESICVFVTGVANAGAVLIRWRAVNILMSRSATASEKINAANVLKFGGEDFDVISGMGRAGGTELVETAENAGRYVSSIQTAEGVQAQLTRCTRLFKVFSIVLRIVNVLLLAFTVVMMGFDIAADFKCDRMAAIKSMDILGTVFTGVACILDGVSLVLDLAGVVCNAVPVVGAICMVLGFVFSIVCMIFKAKDRPEPPVVKFIKDEIVPFLKQLDMPTAKAHNILWAIG